MTRPRAWLLLAVLVCFACVDNHAQAGNLLSQLGLFQGVDISGHNTLTLQSNMVQGSEASFTGQRWDTSTLLNESSIHADGSIWKDLGFQADFSSSGYGQSYSRWLLGYVRDDTALYYGDLNVDLGGNEFIGFRKTLQGWQIDQALPRGGILRYFTSQEKGLVRNQTFAGNNTSGPFYLTYTPIIEGSEVVKINEQTERFGKDYKLDYQTGELDFAPVDGPPQIIPSTSTISVSYESYGYDSSPGTLSGFRVEMPISGKRMLLGVTRVDEHKSGFGSDTVGYREDYYQGSGSTGPFDTTFRPIIPNGTRVVYQGKEQTIDQPLVVLVDNVEQHETVDYTADRDLGRIQFLRSVPPTSAVVIKYYYDISASGTTTTQGPSDVWGMDLAWAMSPSLSLKYNYASSTGGTLGQIVGSAQSLQMGYTGSRLRLTADYHSIDPNFGFINSVGFYRHEKGTQWRAEYQLAEATTLYYEKSDLLTDQGSSFGASGYTGGEGFGTYSSYGTPVTSTTTAAVQPADATTSLNITSTSTSYGFRYAKPRRPGIQYDVQEMSNASSTSVSDYIAKNLRLQWVPTNSPWSANMTWGKTTQTSLTPGTSSTTASIASSTGQFQAGLTFTPSEKLSFNANFGHVTTDSGVNSNADSRTIQLAARWSPSDKLTFNLNQTKATSTGIALSSSSSLYSGSTWSGSPGGYTGLTSASSVPTLASITPAGVPASTGVWAPTLGVRVSPLNAYTVVPADSSSGTTDTTVPVHYEDASNTFQVSYQPSQKLSLDYSLGSRTYRSDNTGYLADSNQTFQNTSLTWQASKALSMQATIGSDTMTYLDQANSTVSNNMLNFGLNFRPPSSKLGASVSLTRQTGTSPTYLGFGRGQEQILVSTNLSDLSGRISYSLGSSNDLYLQLGTATYNSGYSAFNKQTAELGIERRISGNAGVTFGWRYIRNITDPSGLLPAYSGVTTQDQNYIANTVMLSFNMNFAGGTGGAGSKSRFRAPSSSASYYGGYSGFGSSSMSTFGGYSGSSFGQSMGFQGSLGSSNAFGGSVGGFGGSTFGSGSFSSGGFGSSSFGSSPFGSNSGGFGGMQGGGFAGRGPRAPNSPLSGSEGRLGVAPDPWDLAGDAVSLW